MSAHELAELQSWLQSAIRSAAPPADAQRRVRGGSVSAEQRLAIYARGYWLRLLECMRAEFPALCSALGTELFDSFAREYLEARPPKSYSLTSLGASFAGYLEASRPDRDAPPMERDPSFEVLVDLARLERAFVEVQRGPGVEDDRGAGDDFPSLTYLEPSLVCLDECMLRLAPGVRLLQLGYPLLDTMMRARAGGAARPFPARAKTCLVLVRQSYRVVGFELSPWEFQLFESFDDACLGSSVERRSRALADTTALDPTLRIGPRLKLWIERGVLAVSDALPGATA